MTPKQIDDLLFPKRVEDVEDATPTSPEIVVFSNDGGTASQGTSRGQRIQLTDLSDDEDADDEPEYGIEVESF